MSRRRHPNARNRLHRKVPVALEGTRRGDRVLEAIAHEVVEPPNRWLGQDELRRLVDQVRANVVEVDIIIAEASRPTERHDQESAEKPQAGESREGDEDGLE